MQLRGNSITHEGQTHSLYPFQEDASGLSYTKATEESRFSPKGDSLSLVAQYPTLNSREIATEALHYSRQGTSSAGRLRYGSLTGEGEQQILSVKCLRVELGRRGGACL